METLDLIQKIVQYMSIKGMNYNDSINDLIEALMEDNEVF